MEQRIKDAFYKKFSASRVGTPKEKRHALQKEIIYKLYQKVVKDKGAEQPHTRTPVGGTVYQADLLEMPFDRDFRYALVVVDTNNGKTDARPLIGKTANLVRDGFKDIFENGKILKADKLVMIQVDDGAEFKGSCEKYFNEELHVYIRHGKAGRSRQQSMVESRNGAIAKSLFMRQNAQNLLILEEDPEAENSEYSSEWVEDLPTIIEAINEIYTEDNVKLPKEEITDHASAQNMNLLNEGDRVRIPYDEPHMVGGEKLSGKKFRATDIRWDPKIREISQLVLRPDQPIMYLVSDDKAKKGILPVAYTRKQIQLVDADEHMPPQSVKRISRPREYKHEDPDYIPEEENYKVVQHIEPFRKSSRISSRNKKSSENLIQRVPIEQNVHISASGRPKRITKMPSRLDNYVTY
jgi:hypothetical protein